MLVAALVLALPLVAAARPQDPVPEPLVDVDVAPLDPSADDEAHIHTIESGRDGPTVLVVGGVHGDEPAGALAAEQIAGWTPTRGRLIVVVRPIEEVEAEPSAPEEPGGEFPETVSDAPREGLPRSLWELVRDLDPDYLVDLREGHDFTQVNPKSMGSSIVADATPGSLARAMAMAGALNATIADERLHFVVKETAVAGSLARAAHELLGVPSLVLETTSRGQAAALRARQHRILVATFLTGLGMLDHGPDVLIGTAARDGDVRVALYVAQGVSGTGPDRLEEALESAGEFVVRRVCASDVRAGVLSQFDVVVFPGGSPSSQASALGSDGRTAVREFVAAGGGYLGICAGAYLASNEYAWALGVLDAHVVDAEHWARGSGVVRLELSNLGATLLALRERFLDVQYVNGPVFERGRDDAIPNFRVLAWFRGEVAKDGVPGGVMPDTPAMVLGRFGDGRVVCSSPHPEQTPGLEPLVVALVRLAAGE